MKLQILLPTGVFCSVPAVTRIVAETREGSFGILPHRLDCVAALVPGLLSYAAGDGLVYLAADEGVLAKYGADVVVSIRHCVGGATLALLHDTIRRDFLSSSTQDRAIRHAITIMESGLVGRFVELFHER